MVYCNTKHNWKAIFSARAEKEARGVEFRDSGDTLYIDTRYVVLYTNAEEKISTARVQDCHKMLNTVFSGQNTDELAKVPNTPLAPFQPLIGNPNMQFLPLDSATLAIDYKPLSSVLSGSVPVDDAANKGGRVNGVLNIYIASSGHGSILGQAELSSNIVYALYSAVGGYEVHGTLPGYNLGKTVAHEVGHSLSLTHTFSDNACDGYKPYSDIPESVRPNFTTEVIEISPGVWDQIGDNRSADRANGSKLSCLHVEPNPETAPNDMGVNIMDYGDDSVSIMFSKSQVAQMREYLQSDSNTTIELKNADSVSISAGGTENETEINSTTDTTQADNTVLYIVLGVVGGVILLLIIFYFGYRHHKRKGSANTSYNGKRSEAYNMDYDVYDKTDSYH